jgi:hypothetical protein
LLVAGFQKPATIFYDLMVKASQILTVAQNYKSAEVRREAGKAIP